MKRIEVVGAMLFSFVIFSWAQQQNAAPNQNAQPSPGVTRSPDSTADDLAVPTCPANVNNGPQTNAVALTGSKRSKPPKVLHSVESQFTDQARQAIRKKRLIPFNGITLIGLIVDEHGAPQSLCLQRSLGYGLDANAAKAVGQYKFAPATKDGEPVPVRITVEVDYRLW